MARRSSSDAWPGAIERLTIVVLGLYLGGVGVHAILAGHLIYQNYLHTPVAAPIAIAIGATLVCAGALMRDES